VIKVAQMGIPVLLSRSGATQMGYDLAKKLGITMVARAKGNRFQVYNGMANLILDVKGPEAEEAQAQSKKQSRQQSQKQSPEQALTKGESQAPIGKSA